MKEIYKNIEIEGLKNYKVSNYGNILNSKTNCILKGNISGTSKYLRVNLYNTKTKKQKQYSIHKLVATHFISLEKGKTIINHKDGIKTHNNVNNLEWVTYSENLSHAYKNNLRINNGENNPANKYNKEIIISICELLEKGKTMNEVRDIIFGINLSSKEKDNYRKLINNIKRREKWISISKNYNW